MGEERRSLTLQWACVPFCLRSKALGKAPASESDWTGEIHVKDAGQIVDEFAVTVLGGIPWQVYFERMLACDSMFGAKMMSYMAAFGCLFLAIPPMVIGAVAKTANFTAAGYPGSHRLSEQDSSAVLPFAMRYLTPPFVSFLGLGAIVSAVMSSADSSVLSASSLLTKNIYYAIIRPRVNGCAILVTREIPLL
ncbi:hypothetical protein V5799_004892 [Amblyomma americanum]|uniref:Uncharacterized protein n=1 Tax=Amblyomma americanum TaxID=6943 RepID=A0AAQ4D4T5_AMBAM